MAKFGIALGSGPRGLGFDSRHSDHSGADDCLLRISFSPESWKNHPLTDIYKYAKLLIVAVDCTGLGRNPEPVAFGCCFFLDIFSVLCYVVCIEGSPYISPIALCVVAVVGDPFFFGSKDGEALRCRCFGSLIVCTGYHISHFHLTDHFPLRIFKSRSHREASTSQGIGPWPGEEAIWLLFTSPQPWQPSGAVLFAPVRESFFLDNPPLF